MHWNQVLVANKAISMTGLSTWSVVLIIYDC